LVVSDDIAIYAMVVDAINEQAVFFYERYGFARLAHGDNRLFLPLRSL
jgi:ribosomal protein S18 acetylase RimI-like enzyme